MLSSSPDLPRHAKLGRMEWGRFAEHRASCPQGINGTLGHQAGLKTPVRMQPLPLGQV